MQFKGLRGELSKPTKVCKIIEIHLYRFKSYVWGKEENLFTYVHNHIHLQKIQNDPQSLIKKILI